MTALNPTFGWTDETREFVGKLWMAGASAAEIARKLRDDLRIVKSRHAVLGQVYRLGLMRPGPTVTHVHPARRVAAPVRQKAAAPVKARAAVAPAEPVPPVANPAAAEPVGVHVQRARSATFAVVFVTPSAGAEEASAPLADGVGIGILELNASVCKFPVGSATGFDQRFCGARSGADDVYCAHHRRIAGGARAYDQRPAGGYVMPRGGWE